MGVSCGNAMVLVLNALRLNASAICLHRGEEVEGRRPTLLFTKHKIGSPKLSKNDPLMKVTSGWGPKVRAVKFTGKKFPRIGWKKV